MTGMIEYINRFKTRYEGEIQKLLREPLAQPALQVAQMYRARRIVEAADAIIQMGPNAMNIDLEKFEKLRETVFSLNREYCQTRREIEREQSNAIVVVNHGKIAMDKIRHR